VKLKFILLFIFLNMSVYFLSCGTTETYINYVSFNDNTYPPQNPSSLVFYNSRIELPEKYIEIGAIKFEGNPNRNDIIKLAAEKGAMVLIREGNNYILFIFPNKVKEQSNGKII